MIRIVSENISPRLAYISDLLFREMMGTEVILVSASEPAGSTDGPVILYQGKAPGYGIHIVPAGLLDEKGIGSQIIEPVEHNGKHCLFPVEGSDDWNCDPFSTAFYLVTRYEEYLQFEADQHGRFPPEQSVMWKYGMLKEPVVNQIVDEIRKQVLSKWPGYEFPVPAFRFEVTFDIDIAWAHLEKGMIRGIGGFIKLLLTGRFSEIRERISTIRGKWQDPYDNFALQTSVLRDNGKKGLYFFLVGDYGKYDRNVDHRSGKFRKLVRMIDDQDEAGIHPSYAAAEDPERLTDEIGRLRQITGQPVKKSRQHFLRLRFPYTYRELLKNGITDDHSMGYASTTGFRAGIAAPFYFYDLQKESVTNLRVHPFIFMDTAMIDHMKLKPEEAERECLDLSSKVAECGGVVSGIWHNYALSDKGNYRGWQMTFSRLVKELSKKETT